MSQIVALVKAFVDYFLKPAAMIFSVAYLSRGFNEALPA